VNKGATPRGEPTQDTSTVESAAAELYAGDAEQFTERRKDLAAAARAAGDREASRQIAALRKPTRAAWVVNRLARTVPDAPGKLADLASALREAEQSRDGRRLRAESARRGALIDDLTDQAFASAGIPDPPPGLREEVTGTLAAALADADVAAQFASGTLTRAATWSGFGFGAGLPEAGDAQPGAESATDAESPAGSGATPVAPVPLPPQAPRSLPPQRAHRTAPAPSATESPPAAASRAAPKPASRRTATAPRTSARATAAPLPSIEDAERTLATAAAIAAQSAAAEERLEVHVRDLEQQLTAARADLADARLKARHAEAAERKARQALARRQSALP
jgi:hypothetical protein